MDSLRSSPKTSYAVFPRLLGTRGEVLPTPPKGDPTKSFSLPEVNHKLGFSQVEGIEDIAIAVVGGVVTYMLVNR